jgi:hypothetical protein
VCLGIHEDAGVGDHGSDVFRFADSIEGVHRGLHGEGLTTCLRDLADDGIGGFLAARSMDDDFGAGPVPANGRGS